MPRCSQSRVPGFRPRTPPNQPVHPSGRVPTPAPTSAQPPIRTHRPAGAQPPIRTHRPVRAQPPIRTHRPAGAQLPIRTHPPIRTHRPTRAPAAGLTLVELLVTFVILALLVTVMLEGIGLFSARYQTVTRHFRDAVSESLAQHWFATSVQGIVPYGIETRRFAGDAKSFTGITLQPLHAEPGTPVTVRWSVEDDGDAWSVVYAEHAAITDPAAAEPAVEWSVYGTGEGELAFQYAAVPGVWQDRWPLEVDEPAWTPRLVRLVSETDGVVWIGHLEPAPSPLFAEEDFM